MNIERLKEIREDKDLKQIDIAILLNVTQAQYNRYENGINSMPIEKYSKLADFYNTSIDYLVGKTNKRTPYPKEKNSHH